MNERGEYARTLASSLTMSESLRDLAGRLTRNARWVTEVRQLLDVFARGGDPGLGIRHLSGGVFYLRGRRGARIFYRQAGSDLYEIIAYADKRSEQRVINLLIGH